MTVPLQRQFGRSLLDPSSQNEILDAIVEEGISARERLNIYRGNVYGSLTRVLSRAYPIIAYIIGGENFHSLARAYIQAYPPRRARLSGYGAGLDEFLKTFPPAQESPYLGDLATLEWAQLKAYFAAPAQSLDYAALQTLEPERYPYLKAALHPSTTVVMSEFPIVKIWEMYHAGTLAQEALDWDGLGECALVYRPRQRVETHRLDLSTAIFFYRLERGETLEQAVKAASDPEFELEPILAYYLNRDLFTGFTL